MLVDVPGIPLRRSDGTVAYAIVDPEDFVRLNDLVWTYFSTLNKGGPYACRSRPRIFMHRLIMGLERGDPRLVDHINGDGLDNRRENLRIATAVENGQNRRARGRYRGVTLDRRRGTWTAQATIAGRYYWIGSFPTEEEAASAAAAWRAMHMPFSREAMGT